jgi:hypothetical protein
LKAVFSLPLRQTQGFAQSVLQLSVLDALLTHPSAALPSGLVAGFYGS